MAIRETLLLDLSQALGQIDDLERELDSLLQPIVIPVQVEDDQELGRLRQQIRAIDADDIDVDVDVDGVSRATNEMGDLRREVDRTEHEFEQLDREVDQTTQGVLRLGTRGVSVFSNLRGSILAVGAGFAAIQGARSLLTFFGESIEAASDLEESTSKAQVVFGSFFDDIQAFASTAPQALGLANSAALEFTGTFGNLFVALGLSQQAAADLAPEIVQLGADLASFNNLEVTEALDKLRAGLVGEAEPLRALGVNLTAATTEAKALELGLVGASGEVSEAAKVQARYALILEQTTTAQGDFARTATGIANTQRTLAAEFENLRASVGEALIPAFQQLLDIAPALIGVIEDGLVPAIASISSAVGSVDTDGFARALAGLPSAVSATAAELSAGAQAFGNAFQVFDNLIRLDFGGVGEQFGQLNDDIQRLKDAPAANTAIQNLLTTIAGGADPVDALEAALSTLGESVSGLSLATFEPLVDQLVAITLASGGTVGDLLQLIPLITEFGETAGFSGEGVAVLVAAIREAAGLTGELPPEMNELADAITGVGAATTTARGPLTDFGRSLSTLVEQDFDFNIDEIRAGLDELPSIFSGAAEALRDEENNIISDFNDFLDSFEDQIAAQGAFNRNVSLLESLGFDRLAQLFRDAGIDSAAALQDGLNDPAALAAREASLDAAAARDAANYATAFGATVGADLAALSPPEFTVIPVLGPLDTSSLSDFLSINVGTGSPGFGQGETTVINYNGILPSTTEEARTSQQVAALVRGGGGGGIR